MIGFIVKCAWFGKSFLFLDEGGPKEIKIFLKTPDTRISESLTMPCS